MARQVDQAEAETFIRARLRLAPVPDVPEISLYVAHPGSRLWQLTGEVEGPPPYWAYAWAGGTVLARHLLDRPQLVAGRRVVDLGAGSGLVGIAAALAGAAHVTAVDIDPHAAAAILLNAAANGVSVTPLIGNLLAGPPPAAEVIAAGDLFYAGELAGPVADFLGRCAAAGLTVLIGDPGRAPLPRARLRPLATYAVGDFGGTRGPATVYTLES